MWALWLITGLSGQRVDLVIRLHRVVDDGVAAQVLPVSLFDDCPTRLRPDHNRAATRSLGASTPGPSTDVMPAQLIWLSTPAEPLRCG